MDLSGYHLFDIEGGLHALASEPKLPGETAFPELAKIKRAIEKFKAHHTQATVYQVWECEHCRTTQASPQVEKCHACGTIGMRRLTRPETSLAAYYDEIKMYPERFVRIGDIFREAQRNVAERR